MVNKDQLSDATCPTPANVLANANLLTINDPASLANASRFYRVALLP